MEGNVFVYTGGETMNKSITRAVIDSTIISVPSRAFFECENLVEVVFHNSVTRICNWAFFGCSLLESVEFPQSLSAIENGAFYNCSSLRMINIPKESRLDAIGGLAFSGCSSLMSVQLPALIKKIGGGAFHRCFKLKTISIPPSVSTISQYAFWKCSSLEMIQFQRLSSIARIDSQAFSRCRVLSTVEIPPLVTVHNFAFIDCDILNKLNGSSNDTNNSTTTIHWLKHRFDHLPLHRACYQPTVLDMPRKIDMCITDNSNSTSNLFLQTDVAGLTALHLLALNVYASKGGFDVYLRAAIKAHHPDHGISSIIALLSELLTATDIHGHTPIHYAQQQQQLGNNNTINELILSLLYLNDDHSLICFLLPSILPHLQLDNIFFLLMQNISWTERLPRMQEMMI